MRVYLYFSPVTRQILAYGTSELPIEGSEGVDWSMAEVELLPDSPLWDGGVLKDAVWYYLVDETFSQEAP